MKEECGKDFSNRGAIEEVEITRLTSVDVGSIALPKTVVQVTTR